MNVYRVIMKVALILLSGVFGVFFGVLAPLFLMSGAVQPEFAEQAVFRVWLVMAIVGYFIPTVLSMLKFYKTAGVFSVIGTVLALIVHSEIEAMRAVNNAASTAFMYLPQIFVTILLLIYVVLDNYPRVDKYFHEKKLREQNAQAPSVLSSNADKPDYKRKN